MGKIVITYFPVKSTITKIDMMKFVKNLKCIIMKTYIRVHVADIL